MLKIILAKRLKFSSVMVEESSSQLDFSITLMDVGFIENNHVRIPPSKMAFQSENIVTTLKWGWP